MRQANSQERAPKKRCLEDTPNEIMEMIFGQLNLHDLGSMLSVSKWVNVYDNFNIAKASLHFRAPRTPKSYSLYYRLIQMLSNTFAK